MQNTFIKQLTITIFLTAFFSDAVYSQEFPAIQRTVLKKLKSWNNPLTQWKHIGKLKIDSVAVERKPDRLAVYFSPTLSYYPIREENISVITGSLKKSLGHRFRKYTIDVYTNGYAINQLVPNYYRVETTVDSSRLPPVKAEKKILVKNISTITPGKGLTGNSIALWHSHGYYFEMKLDRWEWQRARLFGTVEDISVMGYVQPYLTKMLEKAGANVFLPRERDTQIHEVIVDNDKSTGSSEVVLHLNNNVQKIGEGFFLTDTLFTGVNPFKKGTSLRMLNDTAVYIPEIPADGDYAVYVSYPGRSDNSNSVKYTVNHTGGKTSFIVNQTIGGETWIYLGTFRFGSGKDAGTGSVMVSDAGNGNGYVGLDAVRFGGGTGNVARRPSAEITKNQQSAIGNSSPKILNNPSENPGFEWKLSGKPRFLEAARYYLQYAGMPDTLVYSPNTYKNDYNDDYQSRGTWVNFLIGNPEKTEGNPHPEGLGLPIDLSIALHTDAGVTPDDSVIGTLAIYSTGADKGRFPDGTSRMASRDLSDIIQTQVIEDIRTIFDADWTRRGIWDRPYSEARKPNVPGLLLELLSHQNLADQKYGLDPRFRFHVSRAVYKGILKYLSYAENRDYVVQPLPVTKMAIEPVTGKTIKLSWESVTDPLEPSSVPDKYLVYKRINDNGFDNGVLVDKPWTEIELDSYDTIYSFKVTAVNDGGESFDSEILSAGIKPGNTEPILVVNGFDRISGPAWFDEGKMAGVAWWNDRGIADHYEISGVGDQYDFIRKSPWLDDDSPGWGASYGDTEGKVIPGNSFDFTYIHGKAIMAAGYSFYSVSNKFFCSSESGTSQYKTIDLVFGEEKSTSFFNDSSRVDYKIYTEEFMQKIKNLTQSGTNIFMSGAYIGSDLSSAADSAAIKFAGQYLHFLPRTGHAVKNGELYSTDYAKPSFSGTYNFNTGYSANIYSVEAPDAIEPYGKGALCAFRYRENNTSAGVLYNGTCRTLILGFPFETITSERERNMLMEQILNYFKK
jgi:hypothetical protein